MSTIPVYGSVKYVYADQRVAEEEGRYAKLVASFAELHGAKPDLLARSPGRVNLIG